MNLDSRKITFNLLHLTFNKCGIKSIVRPGFTIVELLTSISIIGLVSLLVASIYFAHFRLFSNQNTAIDVASENKLALDEITKSSRRQF